MFLWPMYPNIRIRIRLTDEKLASLKPDPANTGVIIDALAGTVPEWQRPLLIGALTNLLNQMEAGHAAQLTTERRETLRRLLSEADEPLARAILHVFTRFQCRDELPWLAHLLVSLRNHENTHLYKLMHDCYTTLREDMSGTG